MTITDGKHAQTFTNLGHVKLALFVGAIGFWTENYFKLISVEACRENRWAEIEVIS